jgi:hypothetical protein
MVAFCTPATSRAITFEGLFSLSWGLLSESIVVVTGSIFRHNQAKLKSQISARS